MTNWSTRSLCNLQYQISGCGIYKNITLEWSESKTPRLDM